MDRAVFAWALLAAVLLSSCAWLEGREEVALAFESLVAERKAPRAGEPAVIRWTASARGRPGGLGYEFRTFRGCSEAVEQEGPSPTWDWKPEAAEAFRIKVIITDSAGARIDSGWSPAYSVVPPPNETTVVAVLPVENLSGRNAPLQFLTQSLRMHLNAQGFDVLDDQLLSEFMRKHRVRYTGGVGSRISWAMKEETGAESVLVTSLDAYEEEGNPEIALNARLIVNGEKPEIICAESLGLSGDETTGILGLGRIDSPERLLQTASQALGDAIGDCASAARHRIAVVPPRDDADGTITSCDPCSLDRPGHLSGACNTADPCPNQFYGCRNELASEATLPGQSVKGRHLPKEFFRAETFEMDRAYTVAVVPFLNASDTEHAGRIVTAQFIGQLLRNQGFTLIEPGLIREQLLKYRIIMPAGPSLANTDIIGSQSVLGVDLVFSGTVFEYQMISGVPEVDFSVSIIDTKNREVVWTSRSYNSGIEGVFIFDLGRVFTTHQLALDMARGTFELLAR